MGWDLAELGKRYQRFVRRFEPALAALQRGSAAPPTAFVLRTLLIHEYRRLHLRDPVLPQRLLPEHWPGTRAAQLCREIYLKVFAESEAHLSAVARRVGGALAPADATVERRFGGITPHAPADRTPRSVSRPAPRASSRTTRRTTRDPPG
jgi:phenylacetic acid degradation operon negative regulatory protein